MTNNQNNGHKTLRIPRVQKALIESLDLYADEKGIPREILVVGILEKFVSKDAAPTIIYSKGFTEKIRDYMAGLIERR